MVGIFPNEASVLRLTAAVLAEIHEEFDPAVSEPGRLEYDGETSENRLRPCIRGVLSS